MPEFPATWFNAQLEINYQQEYERLKAQLQANQPRLLDRQLLRRALDHCAHDAFIANVLFIAAKRQYETFKGVTHPQRVSALRKAALQHFEEERAAAIDAETKAAAVEGREVRPKPKAPTEKMVEDHMIFNLPEWGELEKQEIDLQAVMLALKSFAESWVSRCVDIRRLYETWQAPQTTMPDGR